MTKILLVEDDRDVANAVSASLSSQSYTVDIAYDGLEGWSRLKTAEYDIVILDITLPHLNGLEICRKHRDAGGITPILMLTGRESISEKESGFDAGADDYLTKPFNMRELSARVKAILRRPHALQPTVYTLGDLVLDSNLRTVTQNGKPVELSPTDFTVLEFFMRRPNEVFTLEALIKRIWKSDKGVGPDAVRSSIWRIRQALDTDPEKSIIVSVYGVGYRLKGNS